jgi:hypothetical protein
MANPIGPIKIPPRKAGMTDEQYDKLVKKSIEEHNRRQRERQYEIMEVQMDKAWQRLLRINERQWMRLKPKVERVRDLGFESNAHARGGGKGGVQWMRHSDGPIGIGKTRESMPESFRVVEELIDLLQDETAKDEEIRKKIDALQQARAKARKKLPEAKKKLAAVLTTPRQEAVFLLLGYID